jgi:hypothetical protein
VIQNDDVSEPIQKKKNAAKQEKKASLPAKKRPLRRSKQYCYQGRFIKMKCGPTCKTLLLIPGGSWCEDVLTAGERKQARRISNSNAPNELRTLLDRQERIRAREAYATDAGSAVPLHDFCLEHSLYIRDRISKDDRFHM